MLVCATDEVSSNVIYLELAQGGLIEVAFENADRDVAVQFCQWLAAAFVTGLADVALSEEELSAEVLKLDRCWIVNGQALDASQANVLCYRLEV